MVQLNCRLWIEEQIWDAYKEMREVGVGMGGQDLYTHQGRGGEDKSTRVSFWIGGPT